MTNRSFSFLIIQLLELQLNDVTFRQNILVQFLIVFQYLTLPVKFKQAHQTLHDDQSQWIKKTTTQIYTVCFLFFSLSSIRFLDDFIEILVVETNWC